MSQTMAKLSFGPCAGCSGSSWALIGLHVPSLACDGPVLACVGQASGKFKIFLILLNFNLLHLLPVK